ncbi:MAG: cyclase family protein [Myxococcota bacterium]
MAAKSGAPMTEARMNEIFEQVKNWGRWGKDDEAGALNLITDEVRKRAAACIRHGRAVSCAYEVAVQPAIDNPHPALHMMIAAGDDCLFPEIGLETTSDFVGLAFHGMATSHLDALCHVHVNGKMYNGFPGTDVKSTGARRNSVMCARDGIVSRGVLLDMPRTLGVDWLDPGRAITPDELEKAEAMQNVRVREGDVLLVATGRDARREALGRWHPLEQGLAGLHPECLPWLHERGIAVLGSDCISDVVPFAAVGSWGMPIHQVTLVAMGVHLLDNLFLGDLMKACAELSQYDFHLTIAPLRIEGGTGSPVNPIALL